MFELVELNNTNYSNVHLLHRERDDFRLHAKSEWRIFVYFLSKNRFFFSRRFFTLTRKEFRGVDENVSCGTNWPSKGPIIVVLRIRIVGQNVIVSSHRRIWICVGKESETLRKSQIQTKSKRVEFTSKDFSSMLMTDVFLFRSFSMRERNRDIRLHDDYWNKLYKRTSSKFSSK